MSELSIVKGSCLCGAVKLTARKIKNQVGACHCSMCRKWGGGAYLGVECKNGIEFSGESNISAYQSSEWAERGFCKQCGSHLFYRLKENNHYHVPVGIFDDAENLVFDMQVFIEEKPEYYSFANKTKNLTGEELFAMFSSDSNT